MESEAFILVQEVVNAMRARMTTATIKQAIYAHSLLLETAQGAFESLLSHGYARRN
jgi:hypothetical protein